MKTNNYLIRRVGIITGLFCSAGVAMAQSINLDSDTAVDLGASSGNATNIVTTVIFDEVDSNIDIPDTANTIAPFGDIAVGHNILRGRLNENGIFDADYFSFTVPEGQVLTNFTITGLSTTGSNHFLLFDNDSSIDTDGSDGLDGLFATLVNNQNVGENLLETLGGNQFFANEQFALPLGPGTYGVWFQETAADQLVEYEFQFTSESVGAAPVPAPLASWNFNEGAGNIAIDGSGNNFNASVVNGTWGDGSLDFNGNSTFVNVPTEVFDTIDDQITIAAWVYGGNNQPRPDSIFSAYSGNQRAVNIHLPWKNSQVYWDFGSDRINKRSDQSTFKGGWNHWAFTKNATTGRMEVYVNGELFHSGTGKTGQVSNITDVYIGSIRNNFFYSGSIDNFEIYDSALSATQINTLFNGDNFISPIAEWDFNEGSGAVAQDSSGNNFTANVLNGQWIDGALEFNGQNTKVQLPKEAFDSIGTEITVEALIYGDDSITNTRNAFFRGATAQGGRALNIHLPWKNSNVYWDAGSENRFDRIHTLAQPGQVSSGWNHWVFTKDTVTGSMEAYVNGELFTRSDNNFEPIGDINIANLSHFGRYKGFIDNFAVYNTALSGTEIADLYDQLEILPDPNDVEEPPTDDPSPITNFVATTESATTVDLVWEVESGSSGGVLISQSTNGGGYEIIAFVPDGNNSFTVNNLLPGDDVSFSITQVGTNYVSAATISNTVTPNVGNEGAILARFSDLGGDGQQRRFDFYIDNSTSDSIPLRDLVLRYWNERESEEPINARMDNNRIIPSNGGFIGVTQATQTVETQAAVAQDGADTYFDISFDTDAVLPPGTVGNPSRLILNGAFFRNFAIQNSFVSENDYSYIAGADETINTRLNLLRDGSLIFGVEPGGGAGGSGRPLGPNGLVALPNSDSSIDLQWVDNSDNETTFIIERDFLEDEAGFAIIAAVPADSLTYTDNELLDSAQYAYRVRAVNAEGVSSSSNTSTTSTLDGTSPEFIPVRPTNLVVTTYSDGRLDLEWLDQSRNEKGFVIERRVGNSGAFQEIGTTNPGETTFFDFGLEPDTSYSYRVGAFNLAGSAYSDQVTGKTLLTVPGADLTEEQIVRFLRQATFGATPEMVQEVRRLGIEGWLDAQFSMQPSSHLALTDQLAAGGDVSQANRIEAWWNIALNAPDQARQRLAFALSQILVVSQNDGDLTPQARGLANYYDMLVNAPETGYRQLLEDVTFSPVMGNYLDHTRNQRTNVETGVRPDENYAREIMQLFSIGLYQLNLDGTRKKDANGNDLPTYNQSDIEQVARVFTGLTFATADPDNLISYFLSEDDYMNRMIFFPDYHETGSKDFDLLNSDIPDIAANTANPVNDFNVFLDGLANHSSTAPFICRQLIQRTVTSNPSPGYIQRVSEVFLDNGAGVKGDLGAVFKAILLDREARSSDALDSSTYGKLREPIIRYATLLRGLGATPGAQGSGITGLTPIIGQEPLVAPSVFNFFEPDYSHPGDIANLGLFSPEFQIAQSSTALLTANLIDSQIFGNFGNLSLDFTRYSELTDEEMLDQLDTDFMDGRMPAEMRSIIADFISGLTGAETKVQSALYLIHTAAEFTIEQ